MKPAPYTKKGGHLRHPQADGGRIKTEAFQPESQLVPDLVGDDLVVRRLQHKSDAGTLGPLVTCRQGHTLEEDFAAAIPVGCKYSFKLPQQRSFPAARRAAKGYKLPLFYGKCELV